MELTRKSNSGSWPAGLSGNPNGRPPGHHTRHQFSAAFMRDLSRVWADHGMDAMLHTAKTQPEVFFATCARLLPKDVAITLEQRLPGGLEEADLEILRAIKTAIPDANRRQPGAVMTYVLDAIRAHDAKMIEGYTENVSADDRKS